LVHVKLFSIQRYKRIRARKGKRKKNSEVEGSLYLLREYLHEEMLQAQNEEETDRGQIGVQHPLKFFL
jgi:hypothetical protein